MMMYVTPSRSLVGSLLRNLSGAGRIGLKSTKNFLRNDPLVLELGLGFIDPGLFLAKAEDTLFSGGCRSLASLVFQNS